MDDSGNVIKWDEKCPTCGAGPGLRHEESCAELLKIGAIAQATRWAKRKKKTNGTWDFLNGGWLE